MVGSGSMGFLVTQYSKWKAFLVHTMTGTIGPQVSLKEGADLSISLSKESDASFSLDKTDLPKNINLDLWLDPWYSSLLITYEDRALFCGPIVSNPKEYQHEIQFDCTGIRGLLAKRYMIKEADIHSASLAKSSIFIYGKSLGTIAQDVVATVINQKPGGNLPIEYVSPRQFTPNDADHQRTYKAYNVNTLSADDILTKLSEVGGGPDIMFRPKIVDASRMVWEMHHGTENNPRIAQKTIPQFDLTAAKSQASQLEITMTGTYLADRAIMTGGGTNEATIMAVAENLSRIQRGYPLLEIASNVSDTENRSVILKHAQSTVAQNQKPLKEFTLFVDAQGVYPLGTYWPGDLVEVYTKGYFNVPDGPNKLRLLNLTVNYGSTKVRMALQLDDQWI